MSEENKDEGKMLVRLKPYNPHKKHLLRTLTFRGFKFDSARGWYKVPSEFAAQLAPLRQNDYDADSPSAFDVMSPADAQSQRAAEERAKQKAAAATDPIEAAVDVSPGDSTTQSGRTRRTRRPE